MKKSSIIIFIIMMSMNSFQLLSQHFDYHLEESPAVSWNGVQMFDARMLALAGISMMASEPFGAAINPALMSSHPKTLIGASFDLMKQEAFQYWGVNQGVKVTDIPLSDNHFHFSGFTGTFQIRGIRFSAGWYLSNLLQFPSFNFEEEEYQYNQYFSYAGNFVGTENTFFAAAAFTLGKIMDIGIKLDYIYGKRNVRVTDFSSAYFFEYIGQYWLRRDITIQQQENHELTYFVPTLGLRLRLSPQWTIGAALVYPLKGEVKRTVTRMFANSIDGINITLTENTTDSLYSPAKGYLGTTFEIPFSGSSSYTKRLVLGAEVKFTAWSGYKYIFFDEEMPRDMKNTMVWAFGFEYGALSAGRDFFFRLGLRLDPQPLREPDTTLKALTFGFGLRLGIAAADVGAAYYLGSQAGTRREQNHFILNSTLSIKL